MERAPRSPSPADPRPERFAMSAIHERSLQCRYHGWTYDLDGALRSAPRCGRELEFPLSDLGLVPVAIDTWQGFVFVNPDVDALSLREANPELDALAAKTNLDFSGYTF